MENTAEELINSVSVSEWDIEKFTRTFYPNLAGTIVKSSSYSYGFKFVYIKPLSEIFAEDLVGGLK